MRTTHFPTNPMLCRLSGVLLLLGALVPAAMAHPLSQGSLDVTVTRDGIDVHARVTLEEVSVTNMLVPPDPTKPPVSGASDEAFKQHADYLAVHLHFTADGKPLVGRVMKVTPPVRVSDLKNSSALYQLQYLFPTASPRVIG